MSDQIKITVAVHCEKAARENNEDNCLIRTKLAEDTIDHTGDGAYLSKQLDLCEKGALLIVADGMGGMNAGEVASKIAVESVSNFFSTESLKELSLDEENISRYIRDAIVYADACIKSQAANNPDQSGMGTTIVLVWLIAGKAYLGWCGDSRIYRYNKQTKRLSQLTRDHSYVQMLVDQNQITEEEAFDHPDSNIIMRNLGDTSETANPDVLRPIILNNDDVFLLCSDGLCGVLRNREIQDVLNRASAEFPVDKLDQWHVALWESARRAGWHDNVTTLLCHVQSDREPALPKPPKKPQHEETHPSPSEKIEEEPRRFKVLAALAVVFAFLMIFFIIKGLDKKGHVNKGETEQVENVDSTDAQQSKIRGHEGMPKANISKRTEEEPAAQEPVQQNQPARASGIQKTQTEPQAAPANPEVQSKAVAASANTGAQNPEIKKTPTTTEEKKNKTKNILDDI